MRPGALAMQKPLDTEDKVLNPNEKDPPTVYGFGHTALFADFIDAIKDREPLVSGEKGKKAGYNSSHL